MSRAAGMGRTANHFAAQVAHHPRDEAVAEITPHLWSSWVPSMRVGLLAHLGDGGLHLSPLAAAAA